MREACHRYDSGTQKAHKHKHVMGISLPILGFIIRGFIWDIRILIFAYVLLGGPNDFN